MIPLPERVQKYLPVGLLISLGLNLFLGGFLLARGFDNPARHPDRPDFNLRLGALPPDLPADVRHEIESAMHEKRREIRKAAREYREKQEEVEHLLKEPKVDEAALQDAYKQLRELNIELQGPMHEALIMSLKDLDPEIRRDIIDNAFQGKQFMMKGQDGVSGKRWKFTLTQDGNSLNIDTEVNDGDEDPHAPS